MKSWPKKEFIFFGEDASYEQGNEEQKKEAKTYLLLWKKFLINKLIGELQDYTLIDEQWIDRDAMYNGALAENASMALKLAFQCKLPGELV